jgi:carboxyl-terminal processing protease
MPVLLSVVAAALIAFSAGMVVDHLAAPPAQQQQQQAPLEGFDVYLQALREVRENYVGRDSLTDQQLLYGSIKGMVDSLGDYNHTTFMTPQEYQDLQGQLSGSVAGIGVLISDDGGAFVVDRVIRDSPADKAGIQAGDRITAVDGASVTGLDFDGLAAKVRGKVGTQVTITVVHAGASTPVDLTMTRDDISMPLVDWGMVPGTTVADIALYDFSDGASDQLAQAIGEAEAGGATSIVFDLRGNPGGYANEATAVLGHFLSGGVAYIEEDAAGKRDEVMVDAASHRTTLPMVVLVDGNTASAAEVVAGCLQDSDRATIVGMNTVGTGTILMPFPLSDGSVILLGVVDWLTPDGNRIFGVGIAPDTTVAMPTGALPLDPFYFDTTTAAQFKASGDAQLQKAVELLSQ